MKTSFARKLIIIIILLLIPPLTGTADSKGKLGNVEKLHERLNQVRNDRDWAPLEEDHLLTACATAYAEALVDTGRFSHVDADGGRAVDRLRAVGGSSLRVGEVLGKAPREYTAALLDFWLESDTHREVILKPEWTHYGIGHAGSPEETVTVVLFITKPFCSISVSPDGRRIEGVFRVEFGKEFGRPVISSGDRRYAPHRWDPDTGTFAFLLDFEKEFYYLKGGYHTREGAIYTDTFLLHP